jgi:hypothetical protein
MHHRLPPPPPHSQLDVAFSRSFSFDNVAVAIIEGIANVCTVIDNITVHREELANSNM